MNPDTQSIPTPQEKEDCLDSQEPNNPSNKRSRDDTDLPEEDRGKKIKAGISFEIVRDDVTMIYKLYEKINDEIVDLTTKCVNIASIDGHPLQMQLALNTFTHERICSELNSARRNIKTALEIVNLAADTINK